MRDITYSLQCYFNGTILYHPRNKYPACHSERSGTDIQNQAIKIRTAAESNPAGTPAGGISALTYGFVQSLISNIQQKRNDACVVPPYSNVTSLPLLSGSGERRKPCQSRSTGLVSEQPEFVARNTATPNLVQRKDRIKNPLALRVLKVLR